MTQLVYGPGWEMRSASRRKEGLGHPSNGQSSMNAIKMDLNTSFKIFHKQCNSKKGAQTNWHF